MYIYCLVFNEKLCFSYLLPHAYSVQGLPKKALPPLVSLNQYSLYVKLKCVSLQWCATGYGWSRTEA